MKTLTAEVESRRANVRQTRLRRKLAGWLAGPAVQRLQTEQGIRQVTGRGAKSQKVQTSTEQHRAQRDGPAGTGEWSGVDIAASDELMMTG